MGRGLSERLRHRSNLQRSAMRSLGLNGRICHGRQEEGDDGHLPGRHGNTGLTGLVAHGFGSALFFYSRKQEILISLTNFNSIISRQ